MKYIKKILSKIFKTKNQVKGTPYWNNHLIMCPSQCYCDFEGNGKKYCIYLRWRWDDPWTAQLVPLNNDLEFDYDADWVHLSINYYTHDDYLELQKECIQIVNKMFSNITWYEKEEK